ncbi:MAG: right-handed parallel beta-helix repeat-containing protein [Microbacterium sp.]|uniref:right-handed parallel beta-helix repeat-containing protein n=1 Tax=Microbacterium sp. TaxID=51671 RepID=UPI001AC246D5|nr:right-handed parallel beta-helix repeat-containing protein [Microbacterium sp.]MBN9177791.1 right-handed parallel beta-helix repeat-containing protein [Microbacterium sp.]
MPRITVTRARRAASVALAAAALAGALAACAPDAGEAEPAIDECPSGAVVIGASASDLQKALDAAQPGSVIRLADATYAGRFTITVSGTDDAPITLCGPSSAGIDGGDVASGYALHLDGASHWVVRGFTVTGAAKGIMLDGSSHNELHDLTVSGTGQEGVHLRAASSDNLVEGLVVHDTGRATPEYGEGIYIGTATSNWCDVTDCEPDRSDRNRIIDNKVFAVTAEAVDVKEGTTGGELRGNDLTLGENPAVDSVVDLKGNEWTVEGNTIDAAGDTGIQIHSVAPGWGARNTLSANTFHLAKDAVAIAVVGDARGLGNRVDCDNTGPDGPVTITGATCAAS